MATTSARRNRAVWDRPATDTHLLLWLQPIPVFLGNPLDPLRKSIVASVPSPRMITHGSYPQRACPTTVDARVLSRMISRSASLGVEADACANPQMISRTPFRAAEGALANLILILSPFRHSGLRAGIHPFNSSLSSSRDDRPVALGVGAPNGAPTPSLSQKSPHAPLLAFLRLAFVPTAPVTLVKNIQSGWV